MRLRSCLALLIGLVVASQPVIAGTIEFKTPISVFGPVQLGPPGVFGGPDEPDTRYGQQLLILNFGQFVIPAFETGAFYGVSNGIGHATGAWRYNVNKNYAAVTCGNYRCDTLLGPEESANNFFVFDLSAVDAPVFQASLSIGNGPGGATRGIHDYLLFDVSTPIDALLADYPVHQSQSANPINIYSDLMTGQIYGFARFGDAQNGSQIQIDLSSEAVVSIDAARGHPWAIGGAAVPEPASWALQIAGFGLIGAALRSRRTGRAMCPRTVTHTRK